MAGDPSTTPLSTLWLNFSSAEIVDYLNGYVDETLGADKPFSIQGSLIDAAIELRGEAGFVTDFFIGVAAALTAATITVASAGVAAVGVGGLIAYLPGIGTIVAPKEGTEISVGNYQTTIQWYDRQSGVTLQLANSLGKYRDDIEVKSKAVAIAFSSAYEQLKTESQVSNTALDAAFTMALGKTFNYEQVIFQLENIVTVISRSASDTYDLVGAQDIWKPLSSKLDPSAGEAYYSTIHSTDKEAWAKKLVTDVGLAAGVPSYFIYSDALYTAFEAVATALDEFRQAAFAFKWLPHNFILEAHGSSWAKAKTPSDWFGKSLIEALMWDSLISLSLEHAAIASVKNTQALYAGDLEAYIQQHERSRKAIEAKEKELKTVLEGGIIDQDKLTFKEQCFLLSKIFDLVEHKAKHEKSFPKSLPYDGQTPGTAGWNSSLMIHGDPYALINRLTQHPNASLFFDMENKDISSLQPMIRLFKVKEDSNGNEVQQELIFDSYAVSADVQSVFADKTKRGFGVGIKDFTFSYEGDSPFSAKKAIKARLNIFANSFDELLKDRGPTDDQYKYIDLALKTGKIKKIEEKKEVEQAVEEVPQEEQEDAVLAEIDNRLNFRLKAVIGWAVPIEGAVISTDVLDAIYDSYVTLQLTPTVHDFKFDDQGRINFIIDYLAYIEEGFDQSAFNIFFDSATALRSLTRKFKNEYITSTCDPTTIEQWRTDNKDAITDDKKLALQSIFKALWKANKIKFIDMTRRQLNEFATQGPFFEKPGSLDITDWDDVSKGTKLAQGQMVGDATEAATTEEGETTWDEAAVREQNIADEQISFFYVSDLVDVLLKGIDENITTLSEVFGSVVGGDEDSLGTNAQLATDLVKRIQDDIEKGQYYTKADIALEHQKMRGYVRQFKKLRVLLGPLELVNPRNAIESTFVNFGDIPVSTRYFIEWLTTKTLSRDNLHFPLPAFLNQFFNNLVSNFLNDDSCFSVSTKQKTVVNQVVITSYKNKEIDEITEYINEARKNPGAQYLSRAILSQMPQPVLNISGERGSPIVDKGIASETDYYVFFAARTQPTELMRGIRKTYIDTKTGETIIGDEDRGIFHYMIGKDRGIVKTIQLSKTTLSSYKPMRFELEGYDGLEQLREVYNVDISCYANVNTFPGTYIYVDPHGFAPNTVTADDTDFNLTKYGIGGYCMIYRSEHSFGAGHAESRIQARWVAQAEDGDTTANSKDSNTKKRTGRGDDRKSLCKTSKTNREAATKSWLDEVEDFYGISLVYHGDTVNKPEQSEAVIPIGTGKI